MPNSIYRLLTWLCLLLGLAGSGAAGYWMKLEIDAHEYQQFASYCEEIKQKIATRLEIHEQTLLSGAAMFDASETVTRQEWHAYVKRLLSDEHFDGVQGLGFATWIPAEQLTAHQAQIRAEGFADYQVSPEGERNAYAPITFIEPFTERNLRAFGFDMYSEPVRHAAMERARDENVVALSERVTLVQETDKNVQAGTLMYVPVYQKNKPIDTVEQRRAALLGWVYSPFRMTDLLDNIVAAPQDTKITHIHLHVYDGDNTQTDHLLYDNTPSHLNTSHYHSVVKMTSDFNGTVWTLQFEQMLGVDSLYYRNAWIIFGTGVLISLLLFLLSRSYLNTRVNSELMAAKLTEQLRESQTLLQTAQRAARLGHYVTDLRTGQWRGDELLDEIYGVSNDVIFHTVANFQQIIHPEDIQRFIDVFQKDLDNHEKFSTLEYRITRPNDGETRWVAAWGVNFYDDQHNAVQQVGMVQDITERKRVEAAEQQQHALLHNVINSLSHPFYVIDIKDYTVQLANQSAGHWLKGITTCYQLSHHQDIPCVGCMIGKHPCPIEEVKRTKKPLVMEHLHHDENGKPKFVEIFAYPIFDAEGDVCQLIEYVIDINERKQAELKMATSLSLLYATLESSSDAILVVDLNNTWVLYNQKFVDLWHIPHEIITAKDDKLALSYALSQLEDTDGFLHKVQELHLTPENSSFDIFNLKDGKIVERYSIPQRVNNEVVGRVWSFRDITERARSEQALKRESEKNIALLRNASDGIHILDIDGNVIEFSDSFCHGLGYEREEMLGMNVNQWDAYFSPDECIKVVRQQFEKPVRALFETRHRCKDGKIIDVEVSGFPLELDGKPVLFNSSRDITERKQIEQELEETETRFRAVADYTYDWEYWIDPQGHFIYISPSCERISGYSVEAFMQDTQLLSTITHPEDRALVAEHLHEKSLLAEIYEQDFRIVTRDGEVRWIAHLCTPIFDSDGQFRGRRVSNRDITERKQMEQQLRDSENKLNTILDSVDAYIYIKDTDYRYQYANRLVRELFKQPLDAIIGKTDSDFFDSATTANLQHNDRRVIEDGERLAAEEVNVSEDGSLTTAYISVKQPLRSDDGTIYGLCGISTDITERKQAEAALQQSQADLQEAQRIAHVGSWQMDTATNQVTWSEQLYIMLGLNPKFPQPDYTEQHKLFTPESWEQLSTALSRTAESGVPYELELEMVNPDGNHGWMLARGEAVRNASGTIVALQGIALDITERKRMEQALKASEQRLNEIINLMPIAVFIKDAQSRFLKMNSACEAQWGIPFAQLHNTTGSHIFPPEQMEIFLAADNEIFANGKLFDVEELIWNAELQANRITHTYKKPVFNEAGQPEYLIGISVDITEAKQQEQALKASELRFRSIIDMSPVPMALNDEHGNITFLNTAFVQTFGYDITDIPTLSDWWSKAYPDPEYRLWVADTWQAALETSEREHQSFVPQEINIHCKNGAQKTVMVSATALLESFHALHLVVLYDITDRKLAELEKRASEKRLRTFFELDLVGLAITSPEKGWLRINNCLCNMLEYSEQALRLMTWAALTHPDDLAADVQQFDKLLTHEIEGYALEKRFISRSGNIIPTRVVVRCVRKEDGALDYVMAMVEDITERKQLEEQLRNNFLYTRNLIEVSLDPLVTISSDGEITDVNKATEKVTGFSREQLIGSDFTHYFTQPDQARNGYLLAFSEGYVTDYPLVIKHRDGSLTDVVFNSVVYKNKQGEVAGVFAAARDITELRRIESELKRSNADLEQFAYAVSHDMRQPLRMVSSYLALIETALAVQLDDETRQFLHFAIDGAKRMDAMILSLLDYSRVGRRTEALSLVSSREAVDEALAFLEPDIKATAGYVEVTGDWVELTASRDELTRLFQNLIGNALKYHEENKPPHVEVRATVTANTFKVAVRDSGIGIDPSQVDRLFKVFSRLQARTRFEGTGVGLALCRKIVEHHGGQIGVESAGEGQGSVFWFELPLLQSSHLKLDKE